MDRVERLLRLGFLPLQAPPVFTTDDLANHYVALYKAWAALQPLPGGGKLIPRSPAAKTELFSVARAGYHRRPIGIPNPVAQTYLSTDIVGNWAEIVKHYRQSGISVSRPRFKRDGERAASLPSMQPLYERRLLKGAGFRFVLRTDISRFFPTIYTHSIPWAIHGKAVSKKHRKITPKYFGNLLDMAVRQCQDGQTFGLPIGPDTSHIIAECIATSIDVALNKKLRGGIVGLRYVDDYYLYFETLSDAEMAHAHLVQCLKEYELQINYEKTKICPVEDLGEDIWTHALRSCEIASKGRRQRTDVHHFFEVARGLAKSNIDENVMLYALRRISSVIIRMENWAPFESHLCLVAAAFPVSLQYISRILSTYAGLGYPIDKKRVSRLVNSLISEHAPLEHHSEVAWCMWLCKDLDLKLSPASVDLVANVNSSICVLILLDLDAAGKLPKSPAATRWKQYESSDALWDDLWMISYEAGIRGWGGMTDAHIKADPHFDELRKLNIHFYDISASITPLFAPKEDAFVKNEVQTVSQLLQFDNLTEIFEYADDKDIYGSPIVSQESENED